MKIMGIINATPDSFSDGNGSVNHELLLNKAKQMLADKADIIDIGGETTKPGADDTPVSVELNRVIPILKLIREYSPNIPISIDTRKAEVAEETLKLGANIINDVSGLQYDPDIADVAAKYNAQLIIMHSKYTPKNMQDNPQYNDVVAEVLDFLKDKIQFAKQHNVNNIIADTGIGFAKSTQHNIALLKNLSQFNELGVPMLLGISRKRFLGEITNIDNPADRDIPTMLLHALLINQRNINIIRVHSVFMANTLRNIYNSISN